MGGWVGLGVLDGGDDDDDDFGGDDGDDMMLRTHSFLSSKMMMIFIVKVKSKGKTLKTRGSLYLLLKE